MDTENNISQFSTGAMIPFRKRQRKSISTLTNAWAEPTSPTSSVGQASSLDTTFEPTIEMMIDDFDDEQTLNEEEALAAVELQDPREEIATLQEESEIPIEQLLAKYKDISPICTKTFSVKRNGKSVMAKNIRSKASKAERAIGDMGVESVKDIIVIDSGEEYEATMIEKSHSVKAGIDKDKAANVETFKRIKIRSQLLDLYLDNTSLTEETSKDALYEDSTEDDDGEEPDSDYITKTIMVGSAYQAAIPNGLSKYGDILPYENEDKLIWEPSQVSEKEVEDYLIKSREIKSYLSGNDDVVDEDNVGSEDEQSSNADSPICKRKSDNKFVDCQIYKEASFLTEISPEAKVVKDNEQALHLLVQCGYDFKEALRRKRLNAVPLNGSMSIWSEEECLKFEEGIKKFGKDFLKIRQHQVRTRSMRELVQFYYLWKKSERRDHEFADSDTVDHMDMYLDEGDYNPNPTSTTNTNTPNTNKAPTSEGLNKGCSSSVLKNYSIMTGILSQNTFSPKSGHISRRSSHSDKLDHVGSDKGDSQNLLLNLRK